MKKTGKGLQKLGINWRHWFPQRSGLLGVFIVIGWVQTKDFGLKKKFRNFVQNREETEMNR